MKYITILAIIIILIGCSKHNSNSTSSDNYQAIARISEAAINNAVNKAQKGDLKGFQALYEILIDDRKYGVEYSEGAQYELTKLLYTQPDLWIQAFSSVDTKTFKFNPVNIDPKDFPTDISTNLQLERAVLGKLSKLKLTEQNKTLINHMETIYKQLIESEGRAT